MIEPRTNLSPKTIRLITVATLVALQVLVLVFVIVPLFQSGYRTAGEVQTEETNQVTLQSQIDEAKAKAGQLNTLRQEFSDLQGNIPPTIDQDGFLRTVNDIVAQNGVTLTGIKWQNAISYADFLKIVQDYPFAPDSPSDDQQQALALTQQALNAASQDGQLQAVPVSITVQGASYDYAPGFVQSTQGMQRIFWVNGVNVQELKTSSGDGTTTSYQTVLTGYTFIKAES